MGRSSGSRIILLAAPSQRLFGTSGVSGHRKFEGGNPQRLSSPVTAARQRRILTGLPGTHPQPSRCLEGSFNYSSDRSRMQAFNSKILKTFGKLADKRGFGLMPPIARYLFPHESERTLRPFITCVGLTVFKANDTTEAQLG